MKVSRCATKWSLTTEQCDTISAYDQRDSIGIILCKIIRFRKLHLHIRAPFQQQYLVNSALLVFAALISDTFGNSCSMSMALHTIFNISQENYYLLL